jgi:hypothetical protein
MAALGSAAFASDEPSKAPARIEARSQDLLAVGTVHGQRMTLRLSQIADNAPVSDAAVSVSLRGASHAAVAETDGSYSVDTPDLGLPGAAAIGLDVTRGASHEVLQGTLDVAGASSKSDDDKGNNTRQLGWWVLNFAVCIGFLMLWQRRRSRQAAEEREAEGR